MNKYWNLVQKYTEDILTWRNIRKYRKYQKQKKKNVVQDWVEAFLWAVIAVIIINQYLFQAYQIPSGSMMNTLMDKDRIFVNKIIYGPELIPGALKISGFIKPKRGDVIIFESPTYLSNGPAFDIAQRIIYMLTLSLVDIDRDENGNVKPHFLIKRAAGFSGDRLKNVDGNLMIRPEGVEHWIYEKDFTQKNRITAPVRRLIPENNYDSFKKAMRAKIFTAYNKSILQEDIEFLERAKPAFPDLISFNEYRSKLLYAVYPYKLSRKQEWRKNEAGWYIPKGWVMPLGDNRDNSNDGRYFGPVRSKKILGKALIKYWPVRRLGAIR